MSEFAVRVENLGKMYRIFTSPRRKLAEVLGLGFLIGQTPGFWALRNLNFEAKKGERIGIVGRNGAGKSTFLKIISSNLTPTEGKVTVHGEVQALMTLGTGFHPEFTGRENIRAALALRGLSNRECLVKEEEIIDFIELDEFIDQPVRVYSAGMHARLSFAVATSVVPEVLIIDEVLGAGDAAFAAKCNERMKDLTERSGATVLLVSHSMDSILQICNRAVIFEKGAIVADADPLTIAKIYDTKTRHELEISLRAKERSLSRSDTQLLECREGERSLLFRFKTRNAHPKFRHKMRSAQLFFDHDRKDIQRLDFGAAPGSGRDLKSRVLCAKGTMDWGKSSTDNKGTFRYYENTQSLYKHAAFQIITAESDSLPKGITVEAEIRGQEEVSLDIWNGTSFQQLGVMTTNGQHSFTIPSDIFSPEKTKFGPTKDFSHYGDFKVEISGVELLNSSKVSQRIFEIGESLEFEIALESKAKPRRFSIVASILRANGVPATQVFCESDDIGFQWNSSGPTNITLKLSPLRLGAGDYMASIGIFSHYDLRSEAENHAYCVLDRAVFFKVQQPFGIKKDLGGFAHETTWAHGGTFFKYDACSHFETKLDMEKQTEGDISG